MASRLTFAAGILGPSLLLSSCSAMDGILSSFLPCKASMKLRTFDCGPFVSCQGAIGMPIDLTTSPPVARLSMGKIGFLEVDQIPAEEPKGCVPPGISETLSIEWITTDPAIVSVTPRGQLGALVRPLTPGEAVVYARTSSGARVNLAHCPGSFGLNACVDVRAIVVMP